MSFKGKLGDKRKTIVYLVIEELQKDVICSQIEQINGVFSIQIPTYQTLIKKTKNWDISLVNDRFSLVIESKERIFEEISNLIKDTPYHRIEFSNLEDKQIITIIGDLPDQLQIRQLLRKYDYSISVFSATIKTKAYKYKGKN